MTQEETYVNYGAAGVCRLEGPVRKTLFGHCSEYFVLFPVADPGSAIYVDCGNEALIKKIRPLITRDEIIDLIKRLPDVTVPWIDEPKQRGERYERILSSGNRLVILATVTSLYEKRAELTSRRKKLWALDENALKYAEKLIYGEFAAALDIAPEQVPEFVRGVMAAENG